MSSLNWATLSRNVGVFFGLDLKTEEQQVHPHERTHLPSMYDFGDGYGPVPAHRHINPDGEVGGWVANSAIVAETVIVDYEATVFHLAHVEGHARIADKARAYGNSHIVGCVTLHHNTQVFDSAVLRGPDEDSSLKGIHLRRNSRVFDHAVIKDEVSLTDNAQVFDYAVVEQKAKIKDNAIISGNAKITGNAVIGGNMEVDTPVTVSTGGHF